MTTESVSIGDLLRRLNALFATYLDAEHTDDDDSDSDDEIVSLLDSFVVIESNVDRLARRLAAEQSVGVLRELQQLRARAKLLQRSKTVVR